ncbi:MAG: hypothetical protein HRU23_05330 [Gammaproteobacteria bacterium]|nr:hypothetical protein [Gammaproteobacteria bacterium]
MSNNPDNQSTRKQEQQLAALYQQQANEKPSSEIDQKILNQALAQLKATKELSSASTKYIPYSIAASVALIGILVLNYPQYYQFGQPEPALELSEMQPQSVSAQLSRKKAAPQALQRMATADMAPSAVPLAEELSPPQTKISDQPKINYQAIEQLLLADKKPQAIEQLKQIRQQYPKIILPARYQALLAEDPSNQ